MLSENESCSICLSPINKSYETMLCKHNFHKKCIDEWLKNNTTCPICRREIKIIAPIITLPIEFEPNQYIIINRPINYKIKKMISMVLYILLILFHVCASIYYFYQSFIINNNINKYIKNLNTTELGDHQYNTHYADVLIMTDCIYYFFFIIINLLIFKNMNDCCCSKAGGLFLFTFIVIANFIIHTEFYKNTNSYLNDKNLNFNKEYSNDLELAMILVGSSLGSKIIVFMLTGLYWGYGE